MLTTHKHNHFKKTLQLAYPVSLGMLSHIITNVTDNAMVGNYNATELAASAYAFSLFIPFMMLIFGFSMGITPGVANAHGADDVVQLAKLLKNSIKLNLYFIALLAGGIFVMAMFMDDFGQESQIVLFAKPYFYVIGLSIIPMGLFQVFKQFAEGMEDTKAAMFISIFGNILNIILNYIFIFGKLGMEPMGLLGAGYATMIARVVMAVGMIIYFYRAAKFKPLLKQLSAVAQSWEVKKDVFKMGLPISLQFLLEGGAFAVAVIWIGQISETQQAAHQIALAIASITFIIAHGVGSAATIRVGMFLGKKNFVEMKKASTMAVRISVVYMAFCAASLVFLRDWLPTWFVQDEEVEVITTAASLLIVAAIFQVFDGIQLACIGVLRGMNDVMVPSTFSLISYWAVGMPVGYVLAFHFGWEALGVWVGLCVGLMCTAAFMFFRLRYKMSEWR